MKVYVCYKNFGGYENSIPLEVFTNPEDVEKWLNEHTYGEYEEFDVEE